MRFFNGEFVAIIVVLVAIMVLPARAQREPKEPEPVKARMLTERDALRIGKLYAERQVFEQALLKLAAQQEALQAHTRLTRREYDGKNAELQAVIVAAATEAGLTAEDLKAGWAPDPEGRRWVKQETPTPQP